MILHAFDSFCFSSFILDLFILNVLKNVGNFNIFKTFFKSNQNSKMSDLKECKIIDTIDNIKNPQGIIQTPCGKFLIGVEKNSIFRYCLKTKQKFRVAGSVDQPGYQDGTRDESRFYYPKGLTLSKDLKTLFVADSYNNVIRAICVGTGVVTTFSSKSCPKTLKLSPDGKNLFVVNNTDDLKTICIATGQDNQIDIVEDIENFTFSPDNKYIYICCFCDVLKYNLETCKSKLIFKGKRGYCGCEISKNGQILFLLNTWNNYIKVVNLVTNQVIDTINTLFEPSELNISTNGKQLYICNDNKIQILDISKYCVNFKTFIQLQLFNYSFLSRTVINRFLI
jgi:DNA-binding beta-propeller fold protein YncE